jgi:hypothetical protein
VLGHREGSRRLLCSRRREHQPSGGARRPLMGLCPRDSNKVVLSIFLCS